MRIIQLGTRRSLLAWAQSSWVAREIERLNPNFRVELVGIETRGDRILDVSLKSIEGKEFFVAELDDALRSGRVDLTVHSMKDLSLDRPKEFTLAAIPRRENCRDVILFTPKVVERLRQGKTLKIGTSSPRRIENIPSFLEKALPLFQSHSPKIEFVEIRGNVNTRLSRVHESLESPRYLDGVVLAFAGLIRLWADPSGREELEKLFNGLRWMILPLRECPTAPAQGALAVECREADLSVRHALARLHDTPTAQAVQQERAILSEWGGGCHQKLGATSISSPQFETLGSLLFIRGRKPDESFIQEVQWNAPPPPFSSVQSWDGAHWRSRFSGQEEKLNLSQEDLSQIQNAVFVAHSRAVSSESASSLANSRVWTSGVSSWFKLAEQGVWVEGCAEGLGYEFLSQTLKEPVLQLPSEPHWTILTHDRAAQGWPNSHVLPTYRLNIENLTLDPNSEMIECFKNSTHIFWSSSSQFDLMRSVLSPLNHTIHHACGPGKTAHHLQKAGLNPVTFPSVEEWRKWLKPTR